MNSVAISAQACFFLCLHSVVAMSEEPPKKKHAAATSSSSRVYKLQALSNFKSKLPHMTQASLSAVLVALKHEPLPDCARRADIRESRDMLVKQMTTYGPLHQIVDIPMGPGKTPLKLEVQHPFAMLSQTCKQSASFSNLIERAYTQNRCTPQEPWNLVVYNDEVSPGNQLKAVNERKLQAVYWTLHEFTAAVHCDEEAAIQDS